MASALQIFRRTFQRSFISPTTIKLYHQAADAGSDVAEDEQNTNFAYVVCKPRTTPLQPIRYIITNEMQMSRETARKQHLQPSLLPKFYTKGNNFTTIDAKTNFEGKLD